jgi:hypothetical protein
MHAHPPPDVTLLLRAHAEQRWLSREVIPVMRQIETGERLPEEQLPAAGAYLEVIWSEALGLAREADAALRRLDAVGTCAAEALRYHTLVRALREVLARRVAVALATRVDYAVSAARRADTLA